MSILFDLIAHDKHVVGFRAADDRWYIAKPLNRMRGYRPLRDRLSDAWRVFWCKSFAVHFKEDEE